MHTSFGNGCTSDFCLDYLMPIHVGKANRNYLIVLNEPHNKTLENLLDLHYI